MDKKIIMLVIAIIFFALMIVSPAMAIAREPYWEHVVGSVSGAPSKVWSANGIMHLMDLPWTGSYVGTLGTGTMEVCFEHIMVNTETGEGTCMGTWLITIGESTLSGSANGKITGGLSGSSEGYFRGTHGTGEFRHIEKMGTYFVDLAAGTLDAEA